MVLKLEIAPPPLVFRIPRRREVVNVDRQLVRAVTVSALSMQELLSTCLH